MSIFFKKKKLKAIPRSQESIEGGKYLMGLLDQGTPDIPVQEIAGLTPIQQQIQESLGGLLADSAGSTQLARDELTNTLTGQYDPRTSDYYKGLREEAEWLKNQGITDIRQRGNLGGMLLSTPTAAVEQSLIHESNSNLLKQLGQMYETERDRRAQAARDIQQVDTANISQVAAVGGMAEQQRSVEQARNDALYNAAMQQVMFPYTHMTNIANSLLNVKQDYYMTGGGAKDWLKDMGVIAGGISGGIQGGATGGWAGAIMGAASGMANTAQSMDSKQ